MFFNKWEHISALKHSQQSLEQGCRWLQKEIQIPMMNQLKEKHKKKPNEERKKEKPHENKAWKINIKISKIMDKMSTTYIVKIQIRSTWSII